MCVMSIVQKSFTLFPDIYFSFYSLNTSLVLNITLYSLESRKFYVELLSADSQVIDQIGCKNDLYVKSPIFIPTFLILLFRT